MYIADTPTAAAAFSEYDQADAFVRGRLAHIPAPLLRDRFDGPPHHPEETVSFLLHHPDGGPPSCVASIVWDR